MPTKSKSKKAKTMTLAQAVQLTKRKPHVPTAAGLEQGDRGEQVERLQRYLETFGYLESPTLGVFAGSSAKGMMPAAQEGTFDENTEQALQHFQAFNHLPVTGQLDESTLALMQQPRCGFPDTAEFVAQGNRWTTNALTFGYREFSPDLTQAQIRSAISAAYNLWSAVTPLSFSEVPIANTPDCEIRFVAGDHGDGSNFDGASGILAHAFYPPPNGGAIAGDLHFDEAESWTVNLPPSGIDLMSVAAHEIGHSLGLAHSTVPGALMYPYYSGAHRNLEADDIAGIQSIYGAHKMVWLGISGRCPDLGAWSLLLGGQPVGCLCERYG